jgi:hypothetical protein
MFIRRLLKPGASIAVLAFAASFAAAQGNPSIIEKIIDEGKNRSQARGTLDELSEKIGARLTGSRALDRGKTWALRRFRSYGLENVHLEEWGTIPVGFDRGERQSVKLLGDSDFEFVFSTPCWTVGTDGAVKGAAVKLPENIEDVTRAPENFKGKFILMPKQVGMGGPNLQRPTEIDNALDNAGIAGRIYRTNGELVWTSGRWNSYKEDNQPKSPLITIRRSDYEMILNQLDSGETPMIEADIENIFTRRPMKQHNVIAEIPGTEKPDEVVIVCGHFDSWNGPGSTGASDNGTGTTAAFEAARILKTVGAKPKRTIRFILWTGEEQGLLGSRKYVEDHAAELDKISAVLNEDSGQNWHAGIAGLPEMIPLLKQAAAPMADAFPGMPVKVQEVNRMSRGGSDHASFVMKGVPGFFMVKGGGLSYRHVWHTQNDKPSEVPDINLKQMATNMAVLAYNLACADEMMPRVPLGRTTAHPNLGGFFEGKDIPFCECGSILELGYQLSRMGF